MFHEALSEYVDGLARMASGCARGIGPSYMRACCYQGGDARADFAWDHDIDVETLDLDPPRASLEEVLTAWLGDAPVAAELARLLRLRLGAFHSARTLAEGAPARELLSLDAGGNGPFWFLEDLCFAEFRRGTVCLMLGNDE